MSAHITSNKGFFKTIKNRYSLVQFSTLGIVLLAVVSYYAVNAVQKFDTRSKANEVVSYYVDCNGNDQNDGLSENSAWKTVKKANSASLLPGNRLLFKRGCTWDLRNEYQTLGLKSEHYLKASWNGLEGQLITIGAYGEGNLPVIQNGVNGGGRIYGSQISVPGSYIIVENVKVQVTEMDRYPTCIDESNQPVRSGWYIGVSVSGKNNIVQNIEATSLAAGIFTTDESSRNKVMRNRVYGLNAFWVGSKLVSGGAALGAVGVNLHGNDNEYAYNTFEDNHVQCVLTDSNVTIQYSAPFELYNADRNYVHHNKAFGHRKHFEMGHDIEKTLADGTVQPAKTADDNVLAYNLFISDRPTAVGPNIHGPCSPDRPTGCFGPVNRTKVHNNTVVFTGEGSQAFVASGPETEVKNNIFVGDGKAAFFGGTATESNNIFWDFKKNTDSAADPLVQYSGSAQRSMSSTSRIADPLFVNNAVPHGDYHINPTSPAIGGGVNIGYVKDFDDIDIMADSKVDMGAYEYYIPPTATPTSVPTATPTPLPQTIFGRVIVENVSSYNCQVDPTENGYYSAGKNIVTVANTASAQTYGRSTTQSGGYSSPVLTEGTYTVKLSVPLGYSLNPNCPVSHTVNLASQTGNHNFYLIPAPTATPLPTATPTRAPTATPRPTSTSVPTPTPILKGDGLNGQYYQNHDLTSFVFNRIDSYINFNFKKDSPDSRIENETFSIRWTGFVLPKYSEEYTFYVSSDDGARLWINNQLVVDKWSDRSYRTYSGNISLKANQKYPIRMEYYDNKHQAAVRLEWSSKSTLRQAIPQSQLFTR